MTCTLLSFTLFFLYPFNSLFLFATDVRWLFYFISSAQLLSCRTRSFHCFIFFLSWIFSSFCASVTFGVRWDEERRKKRKLNMLSTRVNFIQIDWCVEEAGTHTHTPDIEREQNKWQVTSKKKRENKKKTKRWWSKTHALQLHEETKRTLYGSTFFLRSLTILQVFSEN